MSLQFCSSFFCFFQAASQLLSATMIIHAHTVFPTSASSILLRPWFVVLVLAGAIERLCGVASGVAMERDWVILVMPFCAFLVASWVVGYPFLLLESLAHSNLVF